MHSLTTAAADADTSSIFKAAHLHCGSPASSHADMPEDLVIISKLLDSHTANSCTANSPALSQTRGCSDCPSLSVTIQNGRGAIQPTRHSDWAQHDNLTTPVGCQPRSPMLGGTSSSNVYRRNSLMHTSSPSCTRSLLLRSSSLPIPKSCTGRSSSPSCTDWDLALGLPPKADEPAEVVKGMKKSRGTRAGRRCKDCQPRAQALRLLSPSKPTSNGRYVAADTRGDPRGDPWVEMMGDLRRTIQQGHDSTTGNMQFCFACHVTPQ